MYPVTKTGHHRPASETALKWRIDSGPMMTDIGSFVLFQRFRTSIPEEIYSFVLFHAGGSRPDPQVLTPLDPRMNNRPRTMKQCRVTC